MFFLLLTKSFKEILLAYVYPSLLLFITLDVRESNVNDARKTLGDPIHPLFGRVMSTTRGT